MFELSGLIDAVSLGRGRGYRNMRVYPLFVESGGGLDYELLEDLVKRGDCRVREVGSGVVPKLEVYNRSARPLLILEGEELVGGKQNRIVNTTIVIGAKSKAVIPVSCVEQGRWSHRQANFSVSDNYLFAEARRLKSRAVRESLEMDRGSFGSDQVGLWDEIYTRAGRLKAQSPTMAMSEIYKSADEIIKESLERFRLSPGQKGLLFLAHGSVTGLDLILDEQVFARKFKKLLSGYILDAISGETGTGKKRSDSRKVAIDFLNKLAACEVSSFKSPGLGVDLRLKSEYVEGSCLVVDDRPVHLYAFPAPGSSESALDGYIRRSRRYM